ncbi:MAG: extracellular solute-binding protein, partial [Oscillospiraceae bacterium]
GGTSCVFFNKRIIKEMQLESPYDLVENNQWTIAKFREMAKAATKDLDGQSSWTENDQWGISALDERHTFTGSILTASNAPFLIKDSKGVVKYNGAHPNVINAFKLAQDISFNDKTMLKGGSEITDMQFINGKALFYPFYLWKIKPISEMEDDFGIVPFPKLTPKDDYRGNMEWNRSVFAVPTQLPKEDLTQVGAVLDAIAYHSQGRITSEMDEYRNRYFRDDESAKMLELVEKSATLEYSQFLASSSNPALYEATYVVQYALMDNIANDPYKFFDEVKNKGKTAIQSFMDSIQ